MRKWLFFLLFFCCIKFSKAQFFDDMQSNNVVKHIPADKTISTAGIAEFIKQNFNGDRKRVCAIYLWVTSNIKYDTDSANVINLGADPGAKVTAALRRRRGVCENYAAIFNDICLKSGVTSFVVEGYTKQNGSVDRTGHSWCAVYIDNTWMLCDPTWDAGVGSNTKYFLVPASEMIQSHMPFDPLWQFLNYPVSHQEFYSSNIFSKKQQPYFNYVDSINAFIKLDSLERLRTSAFRIEQSGLYNNMVKDRLGVTKMQIEIIRQDKDVDLYNSSVADLNDATNIYNNFVEYRNKQFIPSMPDHELQAMLDGIDAKLLHAHKNLYEIAQSAATFTFSTNAVRDKLNAIALLVKQQKEFLHLYFITDKANRQSLFYNKQVTTAENK